MSGGNSSELAKVFKLRAAEPSSTIEERIEMAKQKGALQQQDSLELYERQVLGAMSPRVAEISIKTTRSGVVTPSPNSTLTESHTVSCEMVSEKEELDKGRSQSVESTASGEKPCIEDMDLSMKSDDIMLESDSEGQCGYCRFLC